MGDFETMFYGRSLKAPMTVVVYSQNPRLLVTFLCPSPLELATHEAKTTKHITTISTISRIVNRWRFLCS